MKTLGKLTAFAVLIVSAFTASILSAYIIHDILQLYQIFTAVTMPQIYALLCASSIILLDVARSTDKNDKSESAITTGFTQLFTSIFGVCIIWGIAYIMHNILI